MIVPFNVGISSLFPVYFSNRRVSILAEGGIESYKQKSFNLEEKFKFTNCNLNPSEVSEWYGRFSFSVPLKTSFTGSAEIEYRKTAYNNGRWNPKYNEVLAILDRNPFVYDKIPKYIIKYLNKNSAKFYEVKCAKTENILNHVSREAIELYTSIYIDYAATEREREELKRILIENDVA